MTDVLKISDDEMATIFARELYVMVRGGYGRMTDADVRHGWYVGLAEESRAAWRERADRLLASLARSEVVLAPAAIEARVRAEVAADLRAAFVAGAVIPEWAQPDGVPMAAAIGEWAAKIAAGSSPDTTPAQIKVKLMTAWLPFSLAAENHPFTDEQRHALAGHEDHQTAGAWSAFGWRELRCVSCDSVIWSITTPEGRDA